MLINKIRQDIIHAMKHGHVNKKNVLRVVIGELERGVPPSYSDEDIFRVVRKMLKDNSMVIGMGSCPYDKKEVLINENQILLEMLPVTLSYSDTLSHLSCIRQDILECPTDGAAIGTAMKFFKTKKFLTDSSFVKQVVMELRHETGVR